MVDDGKEGGKEKKKTTDDEKRVARSQTDSVVNAPPFSFHDFLFLKC